MLVGELLLAGLLLLVRGLLVGVVFTLGLVSLADGALLLDDFAGIVEVALLLDDLGGITVVVLLLDDLAGIMVVAGSVDDVSLAEDTVVLLKLLASLLDTGGLLTGLLVLLFKDEIGLLADTGSCLQLDEFGAFCGELILGCPLLEDSFDL